MKKFLVLLFFILFMAICEVGKYFFNYQFFYVALTFQVLGMILAVWIFASKKTYNKILSVFSFILCLTLSLQNFVILTEHKNGSGNYEYIVHGAGGLDGNSYLNSQEGFIYYVQNGYKYIELDFLYTSDGQIVCSHFFEHSDELNFYSRPTFEQFSSTLLEGKYHGITMPWLVQNLKMYSDITIIFDTKEEDTQNMLEDLSYILQQNDIDLNRFIIQVYSKENYEQIKENNEIKFTRFWYTNYKMHYNSPQILNFFEDKSDIEAYVLYILDWWVFTEFDFNTSKSIVVHTVHDKGFSDFITSKNVDYVYIDEPLE